MTTTSTKKIQINKRLRGLSREELENLDKSQLIDKIQQLEAYNCQLKNILKKKLNNKDDKDEELLKLLTEINKKNINDMQHSTNAGVVVHKEKHTAKVPKKRKFDFNSAHKRHVLLKLLYFGWDYQGFATQEDSNATIEHHLFGALMRTCLIESRNTSNYHRCGRTDKEVSAFCQVISIDLRSKFPSVEQLDPQALSQEIDYCGLLNRVLPRNIQCVAWMPLRNNNYSARFDCTSRTYRYYFPGSKLNIDAMNKACSLLERHTDFRNFCKMDVHNGVTNYTRNIRKATVKLCPHEVDDKTGYAMYYLEICANAFLWHQIRCIMAILLLIGQGREEPHIISDLLDITNNPCKPQYTPAIGLPLNLFDCEFRNVSTRDNISIDDNICTDDSMKEEQNNSKDIEQNENDISNWIYSEENLQKVIENIQGEWAQFNIRATMIRNVLYCLEDLVKTTYNGEAVKQQEILLQDSLKSRQYIKILDRKRCESLENRIEHFVKKQRLRLPSDEEMEDELCSNNDCQS